jgi:hypothetical protein
MTERIGYQNVAELAKQPLETGGGRKLCLDFFPKLPKDKLKDFENDGMKWSLSYRDATGLRHSTKFIKRDGRKAEPIDDE